MMDAYRQGVSGENGTAEVKPFPVASGFYTDESMSSDESADSKSLELTLSRTPRRRILRNISFADAEFPVQVRLVASA